jgi:hypothetical protein
MQPEKTAFDAKEWALALNHSLLAKFSLPHFWFEKLIWLDHPIRASWACTGSRTVGAS